MVEDGAHVLIPYKGIGSFGEFTFYSPHKLIAIPDGSVLIHRPKTKVQGIISNKDSAKIMEKVMSNIPQESPKPWFWLFKRILQKILPDFFGNILKIIVTHHQLTIIKLLNHFKV